MALTNKHGLKFLEMVRKIYGDCGSLLSPGHAARVTAFAICAMLDGSTHSPEYVLYVRADNGEMQPVRFLHDQL